MSLKHVILTVLSEQDASGYDIVKTFDESLGFFWNASHQQIYRDLKSLERDGLVLTTLVEQTGRPDKKVYRLTAAGHEQLDRWQRAPTETRVNSAFLVKLSGLADAVPERALSLLREQRHYHAAKLEKYRELLERHFADADVDGIPYPILVRYLALRRGLRGEEDWIGWIDECAALIGRRAMAAGARP